MQTPDTQYVRRPDGVHIAYQVFGDGPIDLILCPGFVSHLDLAWTDPGYARFMRRMASFARMIVYDKPGVGLSDPLPQAPALEERVDDLVLLLDLLGSERAAVLGMSEGGPAAALFAATHPDRTRALVMYGAYVTIPPVFRSGRETMRDLLAHWGDGDRFAETFMPSATPEQRRFLGQFVRAAAPPASARQTVDVLFAIDASAALPLVQAPTLVLHRSDDRAIPVMAGKVMAAGIEGAQFVELPGEDHLPWGTADELADEIEAFLTGARHAAEPDRQLATVLFTDIVASTDRAAALGDRAWRALLERHHTVSAESVRSYGGRLVKSTGDGLLATFDGPARAVRCAQSLVERTGALGVELRAGVHTGEVEVIGDDVGGLAVHLGARVSGKAAPGEVLVSSTVRDLTIGSELRFDEAGEHDLRGVPGPWRLYRLAA